jgi:hypothetical protein
MVCNSETLEEERMTAAFLRQRGLDLTSAATTQF